MNIRRSLFFSILMLNLLACAAPRISAKSTAAPAAAVDTNNRLQTMVAEIVASALTQTAQAVPPTFTATLPPTSTPQPSATPTALPVGSSLDKQEDGSLLFMDERAGYTVIIPEGWLAVRVKEQDFFDALTFTELSDSLAHESLTKIRDEDPNTLRLFAVNIQEETPQGEPVTTIQFIWDEKQNISFASDKDLQALADTLSKTVNGFEVMSIDVVTTPAKMQLGMFESQTKGSDAGTIVQKRVFFKAKTGTINVLLTTGEGLKETIIPAFDAIIDTLALTGQ